MFEGVLLRERALNNGRLRERKRRRASARKERQNGCEARETSGGGRERLSHDIAMALGGLGRKGKVDGRGVQCVASVPLQAAGALGQTAMAMPVGAKSKAKGRDGLCARTLGK